MLQIAVVVLIALGLASCAQYQAQQAQQAAAAAQAQVDGDDARCRSYGLQMGAPGYAECRMNIDNMRATDDQQRRALAVGILLNRH